MAQLETPKEPSITASLIKSWWTSKSNTKCFASRKHCTKKNATIAMRGIEKGVNERLQHNENNLWSFVKDLWSNMYSLYLYSQQLFNVSKASLVTEYFFLGLCLDIFLTIQFAPFFGESFITYKHIITHKFYDLERIFDDYSNWPLVQQCSVINWTKKYWKNNCDKKRSKGIKFRFGFCVQSTIRFRLKLCVCWAHTKSNNSPSLALITITQATNFHFSFFLKIFFVYWKMFSMQFFITFRY